MTTDFLPFLAIVVGISISLFFSLKKKKEMDLSNELARLVDKKQYTQAIEIAEKAGVNEHSFHLLRLNLMAAYFRAGRKSDAQRLLATLHEKEFGSASWLLEDWRKKIETDEPED